MKTIIYTLLLLLFIMTANLSASIINKDDSLLLKASEAEGNHKVDLLNQLSESLRDRDNMESNKYAKKALNEAKRLSYQKGIADALMNIGIQKAIKGKYDEGITNFKIALAKYHSINNEKGEARANNNLSRIYHFKNNYKDALIYLQRALKLNKELNNKKGIANSYLNLGVLYSDLNDNDLAITYYLNALVIKQELPDSLGIGLIYNNIGQIYASLNDNKKALEKYQQARLIFKKINNKMGLASNSNNIAVVYMEMNDLNKAIQYQVQALELEKQLNDKYGESVSYLNISNIYLRQKEISRAKQYLDTAIQISGAIGDERGLSDCNLLYGELYYKNKKYDLAIKKMKEAVGNYKKLKCDDELSETYLLLTKSYKAIGNINKAFYYHELFSITKDSLSRKNNITTTHSLKTRMEAENDLKILKKDKEIMEAKNYYLTILVIVSVIALIILFVSLKIIFNKNKKLANVITKLEEMNRFQKEAYNVLTNDILITLYPLSNDIASVSKEEEFKALNESYLGFAEEYDKLVKSFKAQINN